MSLQKHIFAVVSGFCLMMLACLLTEVGIISLSMLALITALWFVSFIAQSIYFANYTSGGKS